MHANTGEAMNGRTAFGSRIGPTATLVAIATVIALATVPAAHAEVPSPIDGGPVKYGIDDVPVTDDAEGTREAILGEEATPAQPAKTSQSNSESFSESLQSSCPGCLAYNSIFVRVYPTWERVGVNRTQSVASSSIPRIHAHVALLRGGSCYGGDYRFTDGSTRTNASSTAYLSSGNYTGFWHTWTQASGHTWTAPDGSRWSLNAGNDRCWSR